MRKVKLAVDQLAVESFETTREDGGRGTMFGRMAVGGISPDCASPRCEDTPLASCDGGCGGEGTAPAG